MVNQHESHHESVRVHPPQEMGDVPGYTDPSILEWEQRTGEQWHLPPSYQYDESGRSYDGIVVLNPEHALSKTIMGRATTPAMLSRSGYGGPRHDRKNSALISSETSGNYLDLVTYIPYFGRDALTMFVVENELSGNPMELPAVTRERFPNPSDWVGEARARMGKYQAFPRLLQQSMNYFGKIARRPAARAEDSVAQQNAAAFVRYYGTDYEFAVRTANKAAVRNSKTKRSLKSALKSFHKSLTGGKAASTSKAQSELDKAVKKGIIHKNKAARQKKALAAKAKAAGTKPSTAKKTAAKKPATKKPTTKKSSAKK